jgi:hypothetical protein
MRIYSEKNGKGLENARVDLSIYNPTQKIYQPVSPEVVPIPNPSYSDSQGLVNLVLPNGSYQAEISLVRFEKKIVKFTIGPYDTDGYPAVALSSRPFALLETLKYYFGIVFDLRAYTALYATTLSGSGRVYDLLNVFAFLLMGTTVITIFFRTLWSLYVHFLYPRYKKLINSHVNLIQARVLDIKSQNPIAHVHVYLIDLAKDKIISKGRTNRFGYVTFHMPQPKSFRLSVLKSGYETEGFYDYKKGMLHSITTLWMKQYKNSHDSSRILIKALFQNASVFIFELSLLILLILEFLFIRSYGILLMRPILIVTILTLLLCIIEVVASKISHRAKSED